MSADSSAPAERLQRAWREGGVLAQLLRPLGALYGLLSGAHAALYRWGWRKTETLPVPVIVVGNWIVGGAGKPPRRWPCCSCCARKALRPA